MSGIGGALAGRREDVLYRIKVKAGINLRSKSLGFYLEKYDPVLAVRVSLRNLKRDGRTLNIPLYALPSLPRILESVPPP